MARKKSRKSDSDLIIIFFGISLIPLLFGLYDVAIIWAITLTVMTIIFLWFKRRNRQKILGIESNYENLTPDQFEEFIAQLFREKGYSAEVTQKGSRYGGGGDRGTDVKGRKNGETLVIQAKKWEIGTNVGIEVVNNLIGAAIVDNATKAILITTSDFTRQAEDQAKRAAKKLSIELWNRHKLNNEISVLLQRKNERKRLGIISILRRFILKN